jgi:hypothetical protein
VSQQPVRLFYRLILAAEPTAIDFLSGEALGLTRPVNPALDRLWQGGSVQNTESQARARGRGMPWLGGSIAEVAIPDDGSVAFERTGKSRGHFTLWGDPTKLLGCVVRVVPV